jgi:hypothetical protein
VGKDVRGRSGGGDSSRWGDDNDDNDDDDDDIDNDNDDEGLLGDGDDGKDGGCVRDRRMVDMGASGVGRKLQKI